MLRQVIKVITDANHVLNENNDFLRNHRKEMAELQATRKTKTDTKVKSE